METQPSELQVQGQHLIQRCVIIQRDEKGYGLTVTGDNPVYVQSVKDDGAAQRAGVQVGDRIIKVNGTVVTHLNHIEVVNLIKSGSYVALTLLGKPPSSFSSASSQDKQPVSPPATPRDPCKDEKTMSIRRVLDQERQFYEKTREEYMKKPSEKLQKQLAESTTRIKAFDAELGALIGVENVKSTPLGGPQSAPPGRLSAPTNLFRSASDSDWSEVRDVNNGLPPQPPMRKYHNKADQLASQLQNKSSTLPGRIRHQICPEGPSHQRQHSSPDAFFRPEGEGGGPKSNRDKKHSLEDVSHFGGLTPSSPSQIRKLLLDKRKVTIFNFKKSPSLPSAWTPDTVERKSSTSSTTPTPSEMEPAEKRNRSETTESLADDESGSTSTESTKPEIPVNMQIISQEDDEFQSDEEKFGDDHGPFNDLEILKNKPAHLAVFLHYLISNSDPSSLFFWLVTESYRDGNLKEMKKWSYEIYSTFLAEKAPLKIVIDRGIVQAIESTLGKDCSEECIRNLFIPARSACSEEINELLADFRNKRALGLGSLFGDHQLEDDNMDKSKEMSVVEQTLMPHLDNLMAELDSTTSNTATSSQYDRNSAMASALTTFMKQTGLSLKAGSSYGNILERCSSFTQKENKSLFKIKGSKKIKGHHFVSTHYTSTTFCNHCSNLLWGIGDQGYQCSICEFNVHKVGCLESIEEMCPGPKKRKQQKVNGLSTRRGINPRRTSAPNPDAIEQAHNRHVSNVVHLVPTVNQTGKDKDKDAESNDFRSEDGRKKQGSFDEEILSSRRDRPEEGIDLGSTSEGEDRSISSPDELTIPTSATATKKSELFSTPRRFARPVIRSESVKTPKEMIRKKPIVSGGIMHRSRKSVAGGDVFAREVDMSESALNLNYGRGVDSPTAGLDTLSEDERRARSRSPVFPSAEEEEFDSDMEADTQAPWQQTVDKKTIKKLKQKEIKRQEFIHELIYTEKTHVRNLKVLDKVFHKPMKKMNIMPYEYIKKLFPNLQELIEIHGDLLQSMKKREAEGEVIQCIGDIMLNRFDNEAGEAAKQACATFCNYQKNALEELRQRQKKDPKLLQFIMNCEASPLCRRLKLNEIISTSYQRLTKYPLLLEGIGKNTPSSLPDSRDIERAIQCAKDLLAFVNQSVKECENQQRLEEFQKKVDRKPMDSATNKQMEEFKTLDFSKKKLIYDGPLTWRISRTKSIDLHVLLLEDLLVILQKQDDRLVLKCHSTNMTTGYQEKTTHSPIIKLNNVLTRNVATDKRAFFLVGTSSVGPQIYELVAATITERKNWYKHITDAAEAFKGRERGRRGGVSLAGPRSDIDSAPMNPPLRQRRGALPPPGIPLTPPENLDKKDDDDGETGDESLSPGPEEDSTKKRNTSPDIRIEDISQAPPAPQDESTSSRAVPRIEEPVNEPEVEDPQEEADTETETEPETAEEVESDEPLPPPPPPPIPDDDGDDTDSTQLPNPPPDMQLPDPPPPITINVPPMYDRPCTIADLTNEESVDEKSPTHTNAYSESGWSSSSSSNETMKIRNGFGQGSGEEQDDSRSVSSNRSSLELLEQLRGKDEDLKRTLEDKARIIAELRGSTMTTGLSSNEGNLNGDPLEARDLILAAILQANRLTVAVSDVLSPGPGEDYSRSYSMTSLDRSDGENMCSPQQQLVLSTSILNEQLTTLLGIITERDMARERLRCDLQLANTQIQRLKQGRTSSRRSRESSSSNYLSHDDGYSGFRVDSPRPTSPTNTADIDSGIPSDYAPLSEASTSDWLSEDNMEVNRSSSFSGYRTRSSFATSGYRSSTGSSAARHTRHRIPSNKTYWSDDPDYESQF
ncbi:rho guanine nucleotide exchange factor 12 isoform X5 [Nematostella vectensis]|uniref:rho guanine nucleotide exchange factor 12 isoform X5 n=1 Tax=Nematostella vectensis TaxID=45351 RepID=UPI00138FEDD1|nr:rho guanine nucleotide exchange factor 12 isoform X5 [Nematostella vectensis]